jgi:hypothetical protein
MNLHPEKRKHRYSLVVAEDIKGRAQRIDLEALNALPAMFAVQTSFSDRDVELYEDEQSLGFLRCDPEGFWTVKPPCATDA